MEKLTIPIKGMHCKACTVVVGDELEKIPGVNRAKVNLRANEAVIEYANRPTDSDIEEAVRTAGYDVGKEQKPLISKDRKVYEQLVINIAAVGLIAVLLSGIGLSSLHKGGIGGSGGAMALAVGVTAGFSTCMALVGGLVLGLSSRYAEKHPGATLGQKFRPHIFFNAGRIAAFFVLGGALGLFGSMFSLNSSAIGLLTVLAGVVMALIGLQLTEVFPRLSGGGLALPSGVARMLKRKQGELEDYSHGGALALGVVSFFLPCGFTQAMQLVAMSSGSFYTGALIMGLFAIGTMPGLLGIGVITSALKGTFAQSFFKFVGVAVVFLAIYNISNGMNLLGLRVSTGQDDTSQNTQSTAITEAEIASDAEVLRTSFTVDSDIVPSTFSVQAGKNYVLHVEAKEDGQGCMSTIMIPGVYKNPLLITKGDVRLPFRIDEPGTYKITCAMGIPRGTITVIKGEA